MATVQFLDANPSNTARMIEVCDATIKAIDRGELGTADAVLVFVRQSVQYQNLTLTQALLLENILKMTEQQVASLADAPTLERVKQLLYERLTWVREAALQFQAAHPA